MSIITDSNAKKCRFFATGAISSQLPSIVGMVLFIFLVMAAQKSFAASDNHPTSNDISQRAAANSDVNTNALNRMELSVPLRLNGRYSGDISVRVDVKGAGNIDTKRLLSLLEPLIEKSAFENLNARVGGREAVPIMELSTDDLMIAFDPGLLEVNANLAMSALGENNIGVLSRPVPDPSQFDQPEDFTLGLGVTVSQGYVFSGGDDDQFTPVRANFEGYAQVGGFGGTSIFYAFDLDDGKKKVFRRREIQLIKDFYRPAIRASAGDINAPITAFQGTPQLFGFSLGREYRSIKPFQNIVSSGRGSLILERDSQVDIFVNGVLSETLNLPAGRFSLTDFPVTTGSNDVQLVVEDETGRVETTAFSFFSQSGLLGEGLIDFSVTAGVPREPTNGGFDYGDDPIATGFVNYGLSSWLTVGANGQLRDERQQVGASFTIGTPIGLLTTDIAQSFGQGRTTGTALGVDLQKNFDLGEVRVVTNATLIKKTREFSTLSLGTIDNTRLSLQTLFRAQFKNGMSVGLAGSLRDEFDRADEVRANVNIGKAFGDFYANLSSDYIQTDGMKDEFEVTAGLTYRLGGQYTARSQYSSRNNSKLVELVRTRRRELNDLSGRLQVFQSDDDNRLLSELNFRHNRFEAELELDVTNPRGSNMEPTSSEAKWRISSFAGYSDGEIGIGRRSNEGFILASRHKSLKDSEIVVYDQSGRRSEARIGLLGAALIPIERAYTPRGYSLSVEPLPDGYDIGSGQINVLPSIGMGYAYMIGSDASRTILGTVKNLDGEPLKLAVGTLEDVDGNPEKARQFFTNSAGRMVAERIAPGSYILVIAGRKSKPIKIGKNTEGLVNVGEIILP